VSGGLLDPEILHVAAAAGRAVVVGHLRGKPADMQANVHFDNVVEEVLSELGSRVAAARTAGLRRGLGRSRHWIWQAPGITTCACSSILRACGHAWACHHGGRVAQAIHR